MFDSKRFFEESWPKISQGFESEAAAETEISWILDHARPPVGARVLDAPCGFGRHSLALARRGFRVTGVDLSETELGRAEERAGAAGLTLTLVRQDMRDMDFPGEFDLALNLFSSIGYFSDDEDRLLLDRFCRALRPGGFFVLDTRNRDHFIRHYPVEETVSVAGGSIRVKNTFDFTSSRVRQDWWLEDGLAPLDQMEIRLYSAHELYRMLRPERWSSVELFGGLDGRPFEVDSPRLVLVATK
ncbi:MAG TPA: class I SAM-dependent methyltransferase [Methylomirabilota bacterium]|nr:class I SAM-dependent methyltransferase [Methylomirabilota bacterium]